MHQKIIKLLGEKLQLPLHQHDEASIPYNTISTDDSDMSKSSVTYPGVIVDILLEIFIFAKDRFGDEVIILDTDDWNQRS